MAAIEEVEMDEDTHKPRFADDPRELAQQVTDLMRHGKTWTRIDGDGKAHRIDPADVYLRPPQE